MDVYESNLCSVPPSVFQAMFTRDLVQPHYAGSPSKEGFDLVRSMVDWALKMRDLHSGVSAFGMVPEPRAFPEHRFKEVVSWET